MHMRVARLSLYAAGIAVVVAAGVTGCAKSSGSTAGSGRSSSAPISALDAVRLAGKTSSSANSFTGSMNLQATVKAGALGSSSGGAVNMAATFAERIHPSLLVNMNIGSMSSMGITLPGEMSEILTPTTIYMKWAYLTQMMHLTKPWLALPLSALGQKSGINFSQIFSQANNSSPLQQTQLFQGASSVRQVGTGSINGVPVTKYTGTINLDKGLTYFTGSARAQLEQEFGQAGLHAATFTAWIDAQHITRKAIIVESGKDINETVTMTITSINQPVNVTLPSAGQTTSLTSSELNNLG